MLNQSKESKNRNLSASATILFTLNAAEFAAFDPSQSGVAITLTTDDATYLLDLATAGNTSTSAPQSPWTAVDTNRRSKVYTYVNATPPSAPTVTRATVTTTQKGKNRINVRLNLASAGLTSISPDKIRTLQLTWGFGLDYLSPCFKAVLNDEESRKRAARYSFRG